MLLGNTTKNLDPNPKTHEQRRPTSKNRAGNSRAIQTGLECTMVKDVYVCPQTNKICDPTFLGQTPAKTVRGEVDVPRRKLPASEANLRQEAQKTCLCLCTKAPNQPTLPTATRRTEPRHTCRDQRSPMCAGVGIGYWLLGRDQG